MVLRAGAPLGVGEMIDLALKFWPYIVGVIGLAWAAFKIRQSGAQAERAKQDRAELEARDIADEVDNDIGMLTPEQRKKDLKKWGA